MLDTAWAIGSTFELGIDRKHWNEIGKQAGNQAVGSPRMTINAEIGKVDCAIVELRDNCRVLVRIDSIEEKQ